MKTDNWKQQFYWCRQRSSNQTGYPGRELAFGNTAKVIKDTSEYQRNFTKLAIEIYKIYVLRYISFQAD